MLQRLTLLLLGIFFITMNVLLWRSEFSKRPQLAASVPVEKVWEKVLNSPEKSSLNIFHNKEKIGYCVWSVTAPNSLSTSKILAEDDATADEPEAAPSGYSLELDGNINLKSSTNSMRFSCVFQLSTNREWQSFHLTVTQRPSTWELSTRAGADSIHFAVTDEAGSWDEDFLFSDLQNPERVARELGGPFAAALVSSLGIRPPQRSGKVSLGLKWEARHDWIQFGHSRDRVYRVEAKLFDRFRIYIFVNRAGEVMWVHLPDEYVLANDAFTHF